MDETFEIRLPKYATIIEKNLKKVLGMSKIVIVTDAREANFGELRASHKSLVVSGSRSIIWFVLGISPEALKKLRRRFSFGRVQVVNEWYQKIKVNCQCLCKVTCCAPCAPLPYERSSSGEQGQGGE